MKYYIDITLLPDAEIPATVLMNATYTKLHKALYASNTSIGVSFPEYQVTLGNVLRLHGDEIDLMALQKPDWLGGMKGYSKLSDILAVPKSVQYRSISRKQPTMTQAKLNRLLKRGSITETEAKQYKAKMYAKGLDSPYLALQSGSNGHYHRRYIEFSVLQEKPITGQFDQFGLSKTATVPWF
tara:strand:+ start:264 stop:812 length:549 start_codon:yes stop_codon:yes gene_type:complete